MKSYLKKIATTGLAVCLCFSQPARADLFGGDVVVLAQILANALKQLYELQQIVKAGQDSLNLMRDINKGISDSLAVIDSISPYIDPGTYGDLKRVADSIRKVQAVYGVIVDSPDKGVYQDADQTVAEAITMNNAIYDYTQNLDQIGEEIKKYSHEVSPGGAQKLTAQTLGVMIHVLNQQLRAQATGLKISAQQMAIQNKKDKDQTAQYLAQAGELKTALKTDNVKFELPRF